MSSYGWLRGYVWLSVAMGGYVLFYVAIYG